MSSWGLRTFTCGIIGEMVKKQYKEVALLVENWESDPYRTLLKVTVKIAYMKLLVSEYKELISEPEQKLLT